MPPVARPALIVHAFAPVGADAADAAVTDAYLRRMWSAAASMGMTAPLLEGLPTELPTQLPTSDHATFAVLAGMSTERTDRVAQAFCFIRHDVVGIGVALASTGDRSRLETWAAILTAWRQAGGDEPAAAAPRHHANVRRPRRVDPAPFPTRSRLTFAQRSDRSGWIAGTRPTGRRTGSRSGTGRIRSSGA